METEIPKAANLFDIAVNADKCICLSTDKFLVINAPSNSKGQTKSYRPA
jgi:hypothetical protein